MSLLNHCHARRKKTKSTCSIIAMARKRRMKSKAVNHASDSEQPDECAIFSDARFPDASSLPNPVVNALRRATEATEGITAPKYCKIGEKGLFPAFSTGNAETSDFFDTKFRCFALKVRMFMLEKSDVFTLPNRIFHALFRNIRPKTRHFRTTDAEFAIRRDFLFDILTLQIMQISLAFRSGRDTEHCHENSRFSLFFSAPRRPFFT